MSTKTKLKQTCAQTGTPNEFDMGASILRDIADGVQYLSLLYVHVEDLTTNEFVEGFGYFTDSGKGTMRIHKVEDTHKNTIASADLDMPTFTNPTTLTMFVTTGADEAFNIKKGKLGIIEFFQSNTHGYNAEVSTNIDPIASNIVQLRRRGRGVYLEDLTVVEPINKYLPVKLQNQMQNLTDTTGNGSRSNATSAWPQYFANHVAKNLAPLGEVCRIGCAEGGRGFENGAGDMVPPFGTIPNDMIDRLNAFWAENPYNYVMFMVSSGGEQDTDSATWATAFEAQYDAFFAYFRNNTDGRLNFNAIQDASLWSHVSAIHAGIIDKTDTDWVKVNRSLMGAPFRNHRMAVLSTAGLINTDGDGAHFTSKETAKLGEACPAAIEFADSNNLADVAPPVAPDLLAMKRSGESTVDITVGEVHAVTDDLGSFGYGIVVERWDKTTYPTENWEEVTGSPFAQTEGSTAISQVISVPDVAAEKTWGLRLAGKNSKGTGPYRVVKDIDPLVAEFQFPSKTANILLPNERPSITNSVSKWLDRTSYENDAIVASPSSAIRWRSETYDSAVEFNGSHVGLEIIGSSGDKDATDLWVDSYTILARIYVTNAGSVYTIFGQDLDTSLRETFRVGAGILQAGNVSTSYNAVSRSVSSDTNKWITVAVSVSATNGTMKLFYGDSTTDFARVDIDNSYTPGASQTGQAARIGAGYTGAFYLQFVGRMADLVIWNGDMSLTEAGEIDVMMEKIELWNPVIALPQNA